MEQSNPSRVLSLPLNSVMIMGLVLWFACVLLLPVLYRRVSPVFNLLCFTSFPCHTWFPLPISSPVAYFVISSLRVQTPGFQLFLSRMVSFGFFSHSLRLRLW